MNSGKRIEVTNNLIIVEKVVNGKYEYHYNGRDLISIRDDVVRSINYTRERLERLERFLVAWDNEQVKDPQIPWADKVY